MKISLIEIVMLCFLISFSVNAKKENTSIGFQIGKECKQFYAQVESGWEAKEKR